MNVGYNKPYYVLPFDHRASYGSEVFGFKGAMTPEQVAQVAASKQLIYDAYKKAVKDGVPRDRSGILVDEEFGIAILRDAVKQGYNTAMPVEKSGQTEFDFQHGENFGKNIEDVNPTFVKVLVRYNPEGDPTMNARQNARLKQLSDYCHSHNRKYMFELLVPALPAQLEKVGGDKKAYDLTVRPGLMVKAIEQIQDAGVEADVWKIEGLDKADDCARVVQAAHRGGRDNVGCIVLGRGEDEARVLTWLTVAAAVPGFIGFAVGRSTFLDQMVGMRAGKIKPEDAVKTISDRFRKWVDVFEKAKAKK